MATDYIVPEHHKENLEHQPVPEASAEGQPLEIQGSHETQKSLEANEASPVADAMPNTVLPPLGQPGEPMTAQELSDLGLDPSLAGNPDKISQQKTLENLIGERKIDAHDATDANAIQDSLLR